MTDDDLCVDQMLPPAVLRAFRSLVLDPNLTALRERFSRTVAESLSDIADWLSMDAWLGGGDVPLGGSAGGVKDGEPDTDRYLAFRGTSLVLSMAAELSRGVVGLLDAHLLYAASVLTRQLIETEYLLAAFAADFTKAAGWVRSTPAEIRKSFQPGRLRSLGGFSNTEYWTHCDMGGHPAPKGGLLLRGAGLSQLDEHFLRASQWGDVAQHLRRVWTSANDVLAAQHARYTIVRKVTIDRVQELGDIWMAADPISCSVSIPLLNALAKDPGE